MPETAAIGTVQIADLQRISQKLVKEAIDNLSENETRNTSPLDLASKVFGDLALNRELLKRKLEESSTELFKINKGIDRAIQQATRIYGRDGYNAYIVAAHEIRDYMFSKFKAAWPKGNLICERHGGFARGDHICIHEEPVGNWQKLWKSFRVVSGQNRIASLWYSNNYNGIFEVELNSAAVKNGLETIASDIAGIVNDSKLGADYRCHGHPLKMRVSITRRF